MRQLLVHPKDKRSAQDAAGVVYSIPCKDCPKVYIGETGRKYGVKEKKHMKDVKQLEGVNYTRARNESHRQSTTSLRWQTMLQFATTPLIGKELSYQLKTQIGWQEVSERPSASCRKGLMPSTVTRGATISHMCIPSCCSLLPHLVVALTMMSDETMKLIC